MPQDAVDLFMFAGFGIDKTCTKCKMPKPPDSFNKSQYCCRECQRAKYAAFYAANKDREKARAANHRAKYPEQHKITTAAWRAANKERHAEMQRRWREQNKERMRHYRAAQYEENRARENALARQWKALHPAGSRGMFSVPSRRIPNEPPKLFRRKCSRSEINGMTPCAQECGRGRTRSRGRMR